MAELTFVSNVELVISCKFMRKKYVKEGMQMLFGMQEMVIYTGCDD